MQRGVHYTEYDVAANRAAAQEMVRASGQTGVPVITIDGQVVVGFDRGRLERMLTDARTEASGVRKVSLGLSVADVKPGIGGRGGAYVGGVRPGSPSDRAGIKQGDIVVEVSGKAVKSAADLAGALTAYSAGQELSLAVQRGDQLLRFRVLLR